MKKLRPLSLFLLVFFLTSIVGIKAQETTTLSYNPDAPAGTETPFEGWGDVQYDLTVDALETSPDPTDVSAYFQAYYDATNLYFYFNVTDDVLVDINPASSWNGDAIELAISLDDASFNLFWGGDSNDDGKLTFTYTDDAALVESRLLEMSGFVSNGGAIDSRTSENGYEIALKVPVASIGDVITDLTTLEYIRVEVVVNDRDEEIDARKNMISWSGTTNPNTDVSGFGKVFLGKFADDPVLGHSMNYTTLIPENWEIIEFGDGNLGFGMNTSAVNPIHASGNPWYDPDGDGPFSGGQGSGLGDYATLADSYSNVKITAKIAKPNFDADNAWWDNGIIWGMVDDTKYNYVCLSSRESSNTIAAVVDNEGIRNTVPNTFRNDNVVMFDDTLFHEVEVSKVGNIVIVKYDGIPAISADGTEISGEGMVGIGSWNDGVIFDDVVVEEITGFGASTDAGFTTSVGTLVNDTIEGVPEETTVQELLDALTLASGASAIVVETNTIEGDDFNGFSLEVSGETVLTDLMRVLVTAEAGNMMESGIKINSLSSDASIAAVFAPLIFDSETNTISTIEGTTLDVFLGNIRPLETSTETVLDADLNEVTDGATIIIDGMTYRVTAEDGTIADYPITTYAPEYPTYSAQKVDAGHDISIDAWFDEWADYGDGYTIEDWDEEGAYVLPSSAEDLSVTVKMAWDEDYLYMYFYVLDDITSVSNTEEPWQNDGIEIAFVMTDDIDIRASYNMFWDTESQPGNMKLTYVPGYTMAQFADGMNTGAEMRDFAGSILEMWELEDGNTGYELEFQLPWTTLNGTNNASPFEVAEGNEFSLNIAVNDNDGTETRETVMFAVFSSTNSDASDYPLVRLDPFAGGSSSINDEIGGQVSIYPNPVSDFITIAGIEDASYIEISNMIGQVVARSKVDSQGDMSLNVSSLNSGIYIVKAVNEDNTFSIGKFYKK